LVPKIEKVYSSCSEGVTGKTRAADGITDDGCSSKRTTSKIGGEGKDSKLKQKSQGGKLKSTNRRGDSAEGRRRRMQREEPSEQTAKKENWRVLSKSPKGGKKE